MGKVFGPINRTTKSGYKKSLYLVRGNEIESPKSKTWMGYNSEPIYNGTGKSTYPAIGLELVTKNKKEARLWLSK